MATSPSRAIDRPLPLSASFAAAMIPYSVVIVAPVFPAVLHILSQVAPVFMPVLDPFRHARMIFHELLIALGIVLLEVFELFLPVFHDFTEFLGIFLLQPLKQEN